MVTYNRILGINFCHASDSLVGNHILRIEDTQILWIIQPRPSLLKHPLLLHVTYSIDRYICLCGLSACYALDGDERQHGTD